MLSDESIVKCGCGLNDDVLDLSPLIPGWKQLEVRSRFDLDLLGVSNNRLGLKALTRIVLQQKLDKPKRMALSDWSRSPLNNEQIAYAARDTWVGTAVIEELELKDAATFSPEALIESLQSQSTLHELSENKVRRDSSMGCAMKPMKQCRQK